MTTTDRVVPPFIATLDSYMAAFNDSDLDRVMTFFAEDAEYRPGNGAIRIGRAAIRDEFELQFSGGYGVMRFDEHDRLVDESSRKAAIRWICRHDLVSAEARTLRRKLERVFYGTLIGSRFGWEGMDVFHFNEASLIQRKFTYANYTRPRLVRELGVPLQPPRRLAG